MEKLITYFETIPSLHRSLILVGGITFFWLLEHGVPLFKFEYKKFKHAWPNIFFTLTTIIVNFVLAFLLLAISDWTVQNNFGILQWISLPLWVSVLLGVALLDFIGAWLAHFVEHKVKFFWRFHIIHHTDDFVDTTTANRHHPGESIIRFVFTCLGTFIIGAPVGIILLYQSLSVVLSQFNHANIKLPKSVDTLLSYIMVSPNMHKVHHHYVLPYTDTNYGNIFSIWDRIFGTFSKLPNEELKYGVDTHMDINSDTAIATLLKLPFSKQRASTSNPIK